jgi:hypothetical protein
MAIRRSDLAVMSLYGVRDGLALRIAARRRIGWFDWSSDSYDMRVAMARAVRVWFRVVRGARVSRSMAMGF